MESVKEGTVKRAKELGRVGTGFLIARPCANCGIIRWQSRSAKPTLCRTCANRKSRHLVTGSNSPTWKGGKQLYNGYIMVAVDHGSPYAMMAHKSQDRGRPRMFEHRLVMAQHLGRPLEDWEIVHHKNGVRTDNRIENLELLPSQTIHHSHTLTDQTIKELSTKVDNLTRMVKLLLWHFTNIQYGNPELSLSKGNNSRQESAETMGEDSLPISPTSVPYPDSQDNDIVHSLLKGRG